MTLVASALCVTAMALVTSALCVTAIALVTSALCVTDSYDPGYTHIASVQ